MKVKGIVLIMSVAVLLSLCTTVIYAQSLPPLPHAFHGKVNINGDPAPIGTLVEAVGEGVTISPTPGNPVVTTVVGQYGSISDAQGAASRALIVQGDIAEGATITFYVNGVSTEQTWEWQSGELTHLDLAVTIADFKGSSGDKVPAPEPEPAPTPAPEPVSAPEPVPAPEPVSDIPLPPVESIAGGRILGIVMAGGAVAGGLVFLFLKRRRSQ